MLSQFPWYASEGTAGKVYAATDHTLMHRMLLPDVPLWMDIDHGDGNGINCQRYNLCAVTHQSNIRNRAHPNKNSTSGYAGVARVGLRWRAYINVWGRSIHLGCFSSPEVANLRRLVVEKAWWGILPARTKVFMEAGFGGS